MNIRSSLFSLGFAVGLLTCRAFATAQEEADTALEIVPVEIYACNFHDGKGPAELDAWVEKWNAWVDSDPEEYSAWTLAKFYYGPNQEFDFLWLGVSPDAATMGRAQDKFLVNPTLPAEFRQFATCGAHNNYAAMNVKEPPDYGPGRIVLSFSDCTIEDGKTFDDVAPALSAWSEYRKAHGSQAGMWVLWPAYGGGDADFDFKFVDSYPNYASLGADYDQYGKEGYKKADELFVGLLDCNDARSYVATQRRDGIADD